MLFRHHHVGQKSPLIGSRPRRFTPPQRALSSTKYFVSQINQAIKRVNMSHHAGFVIRFNNPRAILRDGSGKCFDLRYLRQSYPEEFSRLKGHTCQIKLGTTATWTVDDTGLGIVDVCWDIPDADPNVPLNKQM